MNGPYDLTCEHLREPIGLETPRPRLSWKPPLAGRGSGQAAYRVILSRDRGEIAAGKGGLWDSGVVRSGDSVLVPYGGPDLEECSRYFWAVKTWAAAPGGQLGGESPWSEVACLETAIIDQRTWKASWISMPAPVSEETTVLLVEGTINNNRHVPARLYNAIYLRAEFEIAEAPVRARAYVCGLGYGELYVNGARAGDHRLDPGQTDYKLRALYSTYDVTRSLTAGTNALGIILGNGRYLDAYGFGKPRAFLQLLLEFTDGSRRIVVSDGSWKCSHGPILHNGIYSGEVYDARLEAPGWDRPRFDDSRWVRAETLPGPALRSQAMPPIRATARLQALELSSPEPGVYVFDFGQNFSGVVRLRARGPAGTEIAMRFSELLNPKGGLNLGTNRESKSRDIYVLRGSGEEFFEPRFTYHGFRYVELRGYPGAPALDAVEGVVIHTDVRATGTFACSDRLVNKIHRNTVWGQVSNLMSAPTDCPQRGERMGWLGDAQLASEEAVCNFDMAAFYAKYLEDIRLAQLPDGSLSDVVPPYWPLYPADPAWASAYAILAWTMYWEYGDRSILERHYGGIKRYVDFLDAAAENHILKSLGRYGDWCPPGTIYPKKTPAEFTSTWYLYHDTLLFARIAAVLGRAEDAAAYGQRAAEIRTAFNEAFLLEDGKYATLRMSPIDTSVGQTTQALPLYLSMAPEGKRDRVLHHLMEAVVKNADGHIDAGIVGTRYLLEVLRDAGRADVAWDVITQTTFPGWGYMVAEGATTLWERWEKLGGMGMNSHNHIMFGSVDAWFYRSLGGLIPLDAAWSRASIAPHAPGDLAHASVSQETARGRFAVEWSRSGAMAWPSAVDGGAEALGPGEFRLRLSIPAGATAILAIPFAARASTLREGGTLIWDRATGDTGASAGIGIGPVAVAGGRLSMELGSGDYAFVLAR